jgi:flagellar biogenesis protein FliO
VDGYLFEMLRTLLALAGVCVFAWVVLRMLARRGVGRRFVEKGAPVEVVQRVPLDARRALYVVRAGKRLLLVGMGETGAPTLVTELDPTLLDTRTGMPPDEVKVLAGHSVPGSVAG